MQFKQSSDIAQCTGTKIAVFGESGLGKTMLSCTAPRPIMLSVDRGTSSLKTNNIQNVFGHLPAEQYVTDFPVLEVKTLKDFVDFLNFCQSSKEMDNFDTIVIDSFSALADTLLNLAFAMPKNSKNNMLAYNDLKNQIGNLSQMMKWINKNVYVIYEQRILEGGFTQCAMPMKSLEGNQGYAYDLCLQLTKIRNGNEEHLVLNCKEEQHTEVKQRIKKLDDFEYPHLGNIINKYNS